MPLSFCSKRIQFAFPYVLLQLIPLIWNVRETSLTVTTCVIEKIPHQALLSLSLVVKKMYGNYVANMQVHKLCTVKVIHFKVI